MTIRATLMIEDSEGRGVYIPGASVDDVSSIADDWFGPGEWTVERGPILMAVVSVPDGYASREEWEESPNFVEPYYEEAWSGTKFMHVVSTARRAAGGRRRGD